MIGFCRLSRRKCNYSKTAGFSIDRLRDTANFFAARLSLLSRNRHLFIHLILLLLLLLLSFTYYTFTLNII